MNDAFESLTGLKNVVGRKVSEVIPGLRESDPGLFEIYGRVARTGIPESFERYVHALGMWFTVSVYSPGKEHFVAVFDVITERKRAEEELRLAHQELRHLLAHCPAVFYTLRLEGQTITPIMVSDNIERLLGVTFAEAGSSEWWRESLHPEDRDRVLSTVTREFARDGCSIEYRLRHRDGTYRWVEDNARVLRDAAGRPAEVVGVWTDITQRKQLQSEVALREKQLNSFFRGATAGLALFDKDLRYLQINGTLAEMNGLPVEEHIGRTLREVVPRIAPAVEPILQKGVRHRRARTERGGERRDWGPARHPEALHGVVLPDCGSGRAPERRRRNRGGNHRAKAGGGGAAGGKGLHRQHYPVDGGHARGTFARRRHHHGQQGNLRLIGVSRTRAAGTACNAAV